MKFPLWRRRREAELEEEIQNHLAMAASDRAQRGEAAERAESEARREFGNVGLVKEVTRAAWGWTWLEYLGQDLRYAFRMLRRSPGFTALSLLTAALAIGANTAIFSVIKAVLISPLPYRDSERIVRIWNTLPPQGLKELNFSEPEFNEYQSRISSLDHIAAFNTGPQLLAAEDPERVVTTACSAQFFTMLGVPPIQGRAFSEAEDKPGHSDVMLVSSRFWQAHFGAELLSPGKTVTIGGRTRTIIGILPPSFEFPSSEVDVWVPLAVDPASTDTGHHNLSLIGHLAQGVPPSQATLEMETVLAAIENKYPEYYKGAEALRVNLVPLREQIVGGAGRPLLVLFGAVCFMLLIGCANIANLLLSRGIARQREIAVRASLGASRLRIVRQLLTECLLLSLIGGAVGFLLAFWGVRLLVSQTPLDMLPRLHEVNVDSGVLAFTLSVSLLSGILFGIVPSLWASKADLTGALKEGSSGAGDSLRRSAARRLLVVSEVALSLVLLIGAGLMVKSFRNLLNVNLGFEPKEVLTMRLTLSWAKYPQWRIFYQRLLQRIEGLPGVGAAGVATQLPLDKPRSNSSFAVEGRDLQPGTNIADSQMISPDYFRAMGIQLLRGRQFTEADGRNSPVVIVNETLANLAWPDEDAVGKPLRVRSDSPPAEVVGVVADLKNRGVRAETKSEMYFPHAETSLPLVPPTNSWALVVRLASDPLRATNSVRALTREIDPEVPVYNAQSMARIVSDSISETAFTMLLLVVFALTALTLMAIGVYGVMSYGVTQRAHEIGIRTALGATPSGLTRLVVGQGFLLACCGVAIGLVAAFALTRVLSVLLYGVSAIDPEIFVGIPVFLAAVTLSACYLPARRITSADPMTALRYE